jgi:hypothetical protein
MVVFFKWWWFMVFNTTFNNISVISWQSVLLVEETRVPGQNHRPAASHRQTLSHNVVSFSNRKKRLCRGLSKKRYCQKWFLLANY